jgi:hypothetical protein
MKQLKTILRETEDASNPYEMIARAEKRGEISLTTYFAACAAGDGLTREEAAEVLREYYQRAGVAHLCPV